MAVYLHTGLPVRLREAYERQPMHAAAIHPGESRPPELHHHFTSTCDAPITQAKVEGHRKLSEMRATGKGPSLQRMVGVTQRVVHGGEELVQRGRGHEGTYVAGSHVGFRGKPT